MLPELRPLQDADHYVRVSSGNASASGGYRLRVEVRRESLAAPPAVWLELASNPAGWEATLRTAGTTVPLSGLNVLLAYDAGRLRQANALQGSAASEFTWSFPPALPAHLAIEYHASPMRTLPATPSDVLALVDFATRSGVPPGPDSVAVLSVSATNNATTVRVFRPTADAGLPQSVTVAAASTQALALDGRHSVDPNRPARKLEYRWRQVSGPPVTLSNEQALTPTFHAP